MTNYPKICPFCGKELTIPGSRVWLGGWVTECSDCGEIKIGTPNEPTSALPFLRKLNKEVEKEE